MLDFYERFTAICKSKSISRSSIIKKAGLSTTNLTYWKNGASPKLETVENLANALEVSVEQLLGINSPTTPFMDFVMQNFNSLDEAQSILQRALIHREYHSCWCCECKHYAEPEQVCVNGDSDNCADFMSPYSSCEHCERKSKETLHNA